MVCKSTTVYLNYYNTIRAKLNEVIQSQIDKLPLYKFIPLIYQIISRLDIQNTPFSITLFNFAYKLCYYHPYHSIPLVLALFKGEKGKNDVKSNRYKIFDKLINNLMDEKYNEMIKNIQLLYELLVCIAKEKDALRTEHKFSRLRRELLNIHKSINHKVIPLLTLNQDVCGDCNYSKYIKIDKYIDTFKVLFIIIYIDC